MAVPHSLDVLFLTNFSDYCYRCIPAIAQMADALHMRLTILHAYDPAKTRDGDAEMQVNSFYPEADRYSSCRRMAVAGTVVDAVRRHVSLWPTNLLVVPASDPIGLPRLGDRSLRARLLEECGTPVWTVGRRIHWPNLQQPVRNVACWLDFYDFRTNHLAFAIDYAKKMHATLHLVRAIPEINEGSLVHPVDQNKALHPDAAVGEILRLCRDSSIRPEVHVAFGQGRKAMTRLLRQCEANVVFVRNQESRIAKWLGLGSSCSELPCPAIYVGDRVNVPVWNLQRSVDRRPMVQMSSLVSDLGLV
jgi:hypothetical protein